MIENYQNRILKPEEIVDYANEMMTGFRPEHIQMEPMVGFRVLCKDMNAHISTQADRFMFLEQAMNASGILRNSGCVVRETRFNEGLDGFWVITFPVPLSQLARQLMNLQNVLHFFATQFGIVTTDVCEINVSGHCNAGETEARLGMITLGQFGYALLEPNGTPYKLGCVVRINDHFALLRTMWDFSRGVQTPGKVANRFSELTIIPQLLAAAFH